MKQEEGEKLIVHPREYYLNDYCTFSYFVPNIHKFHEMTFDLGGYYCCFSSHNSRV